MTWGIIAQDRYTDLPLRHYNMDIINALNEKIPQDISEFYELLVNLNKNYTDVSPLEIPKDSILYNLSDILNAYGVEVYRQNYNYFSQIQYSEEFARYVDITDSQAFRDTISFLKSLADEGLLKISDFSDKSIQARFSNGNVFSLYRPMPLISDDLRASFEIQYGYGLSSPEYSTASIIPYKALTVCVIGGNSQNPKKIFNRLLEAFYTNQEGNIVSSFGYPQESSYVKMGSRIIFNENYSSDNKFIPIYLPELADLQVSNTIGEGDAAFWEKLDTEGDYINSLEDSSIYSPYNSHYLKTTYFSSELYSLAKVLNDCLLEYLIGNFSEEEFYSKYEGVIKTANSRDIISRLNQYYGCN